MRMLLEELRAPLAPLTRRQWLLLAILFVAMAATRFIARSHSLIDWDETLFCLGVGEYDVAREQPHAPGYPVFVAAAQLLRMVRPTDFKALQTVAALAAMALFPVMFFFARELRLRFPIALAAAALLMFLPTVWYFGGTGFSDVPSLCMTTLACAMLLRGARDRRFFLAGMFVAALAAGIRPQTVMITAIAGIVAALALRSLRTFVIGCAIAAVSVAAIYITAIWLSSNPPHGYIAMWKHTSRHVKVVDSYHNPNRPPLGELAHPFLVQPFRGGLAGQVIVVLAAIGLAESFWRRRAGLWLALVMFLPVALFSWVMLDITSLTRYALTYLPVHVLLAASGLAAVCALARRHADSALALTTMILTAALVQWTWPTLAIVRGSDSPLVTMFRWLEENVRPENVYLDNEFLLQSRYLSKGRGYPIVFEEDRDLPPEAYGPGSFLAVEGFAPQPNPRIFTRGDAGRLFEIGRPRYRVVSLIPLDTMLRYGRGWHQLEMSHEMWWRWMTKTGEIGVRPVEGYGEVRLSVVAPEGLPHRPTLMVWWNGAVIDRRLLANNENELRYVVPSRRDAMNELRLEVDLTMNPKRAGLREDDREFGLMLQDIGWKRASK